MNLSALLPVAVVLALAACGAAQQAPIQPIATPINVPPTSSASASAQVPPKRAESTTLRLIIAGAVPRRVVRYRFSATQKRDRDDQAAYQPRRRCGSRLRSGRKAPGPPPEDRR